MQWEKIDGFNNYSVSDTGLVRNDTTSRILKPCTGNHGYYMVFLHKNNKGNQKTVHRLVAAAFIPNTDNKRCVNHIDGNKQNNCVANLEWCTHSENQQHRCRVLKKIRLPEEAWEATRKPVKCIETGVIYASVNEAARQCGLWQQNISKVLAGQMKTTGGLHWGYAK